VKEIVNLAVLHETKGIIHFTLSTFLQKTTWWGNFWDEDFVPWDAPYEEYVYNRDDSISVFADPDSLRPFNTNNPVESLYTDPFRPLPPRPTDSLNYHKFLEDFYQWKYAPYARNYNTLAESNNQLHIIGNELLSLWKTQNIATIIPDSSNIFPPEIVTFSPIDTTGITDDINLFFVNKDLKHATMGCTVKIARTFPSEYEEIFASVPSQLDTALILDLSERHLINRTIDTNYITFYVTLGAGEGKLVRLMEGTEIADAMVSDPDIVFGLVKSGLVLAPLYEFTEDDTIQLSAHIYNLGFNSVDFLGVNFYDGPVDPQNLIGASTVSLPPLALGDTLPAKATAGINWSTDTVSVSPHDIHVFADPISDVPERGGNNEANMTLLIHPEDYATAVVGNPWDMNEIPGDSTTDDIDTLEYLQITPDSITGVWEGKTLALTANPKIHLHLTDTIDSSYNQFSFRMLQDTGAGVVSDSVYIGWIGTTGADSVAELFNLGEWNILEINLSNDPQWNQVTDLWIKPYWKKEKSFFVKLAWVKLTKKP
jgi:hypothetical protein